MTERARQKEFVPAINIARVITDDRTEFDVYLDVARKLVKVQLGSQLSGLAITAAHKQEIIEAEAYSLAQPAHLQDASDYEPTQLLLMLDKIGVFGQPQV